MQVQARRQKFRQTMQELGLGVMLITTQENRRYLSNFSGSAGILVLRAEGKDALVADGRYWAQVDQECSDLELIRFLPDQHTSLLQCAAAHLDPQGGQLGLEGRQMVVSDYLALQRDLGPNWSLRPLDKAVEELRQCKDPAELELMRQAARIADRAFRNSLEALKVGMSERDFCLELEFQMQKLGARKPAFDTIVASGPNGAFPHAGVSSRPIGAHELITVDFGAYREGYNSDMTRTLWLGRLSERNRFIYQSVRTAQRLAVEAVAPGKTCRQVDRVAREYLEQVGLGEYFSHGLGHGLGLAVHELPNVRSTVDTPLEPGMVITIEPGVYIPGETGCRVEDAVVVTAEGCERLTRSPYQEVEQSHPLEAVGT